MNQKPVTNDDLRAARMDRAAYNNTQASRGHQLAFAIVNAVVKSNAPVARHIALRIKGMQ